MMRQASLMTISLVLLTTCFVAQVRKDDSKSENRPRIVGTWELVSTEEHLTDGSKRPYSDVGPRGQGYLMYTADGHMCAAGMNPDRPRWEDVNTPTELEKLRAIDGFFGYCGRYEIDVLNHAIYHYPEVALDPNAVGTKQIRPYSFDSGILSFSDKDTTPGVESYAIRWKKMPSIDPAPSAQDDPVAWITEYEHNTAAADLAGDVPFYQKYLADEWSDGMSNGQFQTKQELISDLSDKAHNITFHETLSDIKVRVYGDTAVATYKEMYDALTGGKRIARTIITTDTFAKISGQWKLVAAHSSAVAHP
jgi:ketosteroid isomerase-like protein